MKITKIRTHVMGVAGAGGHAPKRNWIFVTVETDEGITGVGEATTEYHEQAVVSMIDQHLAPLLVGHDPTRVTHAWQRMQRFFWWRGGVVASSAASGVEQALWDISGKACGPRRLAAQSPFPDWEAPSMHGTRTTCGIPT